MDIKLFEYADIFIITIILLIVILLIIKYSIKKTKTKRDYIIAEKQILGGRKEQEDSFATLKSDNVIIAIVADGMGGLNYGKLASDTAVSTFITEFLKTYEIDNYPTFLRNTAYISNFNILKVANENKLGTTLISVILKKNKLYWVSIGDSHLYLYRNKELTQLNQVHTFQGILKEQYKEGRITREEVFSNPKKNQLTSYLGCEDFYDMDYSREGFEIKSKDKIVICTDGVYNSIPEEELEIIFNKNSNPVKISKIIMDKIEDKNIKNQDNATIIILEKT